MTHPILEVSRSGMDVEYRRVELVAHNIANAGTTASSAEGAYFPLRLVSGPKLAGKVDPTAVQKAALRTPMLPGVQVYSYEPTSAVPRQVYEPAHPQADASGYVTYPGIDQVGEMTTMMRALRTYEANVAVFNATRTMTMKAIELGGRP
jgi:flagellar basal-body rod protein FlgC